MGACLGSEAANDHRKASGSVVELVEQLQGCKELVKDEGTAIFVRFSDVVTDGLADVADSENFEISKLMCRACLEIQGSYTMDDTVPTQAEQMEQVARKSFKYVLKQGKKFEQYLATTLAGDGTVGPLQKVTEAVKALTKDQRQVMFDIIANVVVQKGRSLEVKVEISEDGIKELACKAKELSLADATQYLENTLTLKVQQWAAVSKWRYVTSTDIQKAKGTARYHKTKKDWVKDVPGTNAYIRKRMDYNYFVQVNFERVIWQDALINFDMFPMLSKDHQRFRKFSLPWVVYSAGGMGAGKGYVKKWLDTQGYLPMKRFIGVDPDEIRKRLPEWPVLSRDLPQEAGYLTQMEATNIGDVVAKKALSNRYCVFIDGSQRDKLVP